MSGRTRMNHAILLIVFAAGPSVFGPDGRFHLEHSRDEFGIRSHGIVERLGPNRTRFYPLPQSTAGDYIRLRPKDLRINPFRPDQYERREVIGPYQIEDGKIWFGNSYYDGEGMRGVGAFGSFDTSTRRYTLFSPPAVAPYEISAILVEPDRIWIALDRFGEDISKSPGGLVRWNRKTHETRKYPLEFTIDGIRTDGDALRLNTRGGYAIFRNGELRRFLSSGKPIAKFPPPPTHY
ncbi:MAG: hypothetical protein M3Z09_05795 [Acidobacteriota bacterium]|nr:hypothetical protein [Acidobacteriota bacterium]